MSEVGTAREAAQSQVFISYSRSESEYARRLTEALKNTGHRVWFDESEILPGEDIGSAILDGLGQSDSVVILVPGERPERSWANSEVALALAMQRERPGLHIVPVLVSEGSTAPVLLRNRSAIRASGKSIQQVAEEIGAAVSSAAPAYDPEKARRRQDALLEALDAEHAALRSELRSYEAAQEIRSEGLRLKAAGAGMIASVLGGVAAVMVSVAATGFDAFQWIGSLAAAVGVVAGLDASRRLRSSRKSSRRGDRP